MQVATPGRLLSLCGHVPSSTRQRNISKRQSQCTSALMNRDDSETAVDESSSAFDLIQRQGVYLLTRDLNVP